MIGKKKQPDPQTRNVRSQQRANVFSYYANRAPSETGSTRRNEQAAPPRQLFKRSYVSFAPSVLAIIVLVMCGLYMTTLSTQPKLQLSGDNSSKAMLASSAQYEKDMQKVLAESFQNRSKILINTDALAEELEQEFPELGEMSVVLPIVGRRPVVQAQPTKPVLILATADEAYAVDQGGRVGVRAALLPSSVRDELPVLQDQTGVSLDQGKHGLSKASTLFVADVAYQLKQAKIPVQSMILTASPDEMHVKIRDKQYYVKFNLRGESRVQSGAFIATKKKLERDGVTPKQYVDARVAGKVYYK